tara:strand:+ start:2492 stop:2626 length:135 start_codon:yes stop_codon:yes gene_type:complete
MILNLAQFKGKNLAFINFFKLLVVVVFNYNNSKMHQNKLNLFYE